MNLKFTPNKSHFTYDWIGNERAGVIEVHIFPISLEKKNYQIIIYKDFTKYIYKYLLKSAFSLSWVEKNNRYTT